MTKGEATTTSSMISLSKTIIGAGMLALPYAFRADGILLGILIIVLAGLTAWFGLFLQMKSVRFLPAGSEANFFTVCLLTYPKLSLIFDIAIFLQCFGCGVSYLIIIGDLLPELVRVSRTLAILLSAVVIVPLCFMKKIDSLKYASVVGLSGIFYIFALVVYHFVAQDVPVENTGPVSAVKPQGFAAMASTFSIIVFAYTGHQNMYSIINESRDRSEKNILRIITRVMVFIAAFFVAIGLAGYLTFGDAVASNIVLMYDTGNLFNLFGRFAIILVVTLTLPLMFHPARISANNIVYSLTKHKNPESAPLLSNSDENLDQNLIESRNESQSKAVAVPFPDNVYYTLTTVMLVLSYVLALSVKEFAVVLSLVGATGSTSISFILPGLFGYKLLGNNEAANGYAAERLLKHLSLALTIWGFFVMFVCVGATLLL